MVPRREGRLRRPAAADGAAVEEEHHRWEAGDPVPLNRVALDLLLQERGVVFDEVTHFQKDGKLCGQVTGVVNRDGNIYLKVQPTGTTVEGLLRFHSGSPNACVRVHRCGVDCGGDHAAEDLCHGRQVRKMKRPEEEEAWVNNLEKVAPMEVADELGHLRSAMEDAPGGKPPVKELPPKEDAAKETEDKKSKKKKKKEQVKKDKKDPKKSGSEDADKEPPQDGTKPKLASQKSLRAVFGGTGLDPRDKVRSKVARRAKRYLRKKTNKSTSSSSGSSDSSSLSGLEDGEETLFEQETKVKTLSVKFPGALAAQTLTQMRATLLQGQGLEEPKGGFHQGVPLQYFRTHLHHRVQGPAHREMLTLAAALDSLCRGRGAQTADIISQRLKACESTLAGTHYSVARRMELTPAESMQLSGPAELREAQRDSYQDQKTKWLAGQPDGRAPNNQKGAGKKGQGKEDGRKGQGKGKRSGEQKGQDQWKKQNESGGKS